MVGDKPILKNFTNGNGFFVYDTYTNCLFGVSKEIYCEICKLKQIGISKYRDLGRNDEPYNDVIILLDKGLFRNSFIEHIKHPDSNYLSEMTDRCMNQLILGVTNSCNFKCRYCQQAEGKILSSQKMMDKETAFRSVDFLYKHSKDAFGVTITFYGGEPLLNFELIKNVVHYSIQRFKTKPVMFNMTTNASLLDEKKLDFLVANNFKLLISLDGDRIVQNKHRKYLHSGEGTFDTVWSNIQHIKNNYTDYFRSNISFNSVMLHDESSENVMRFFANNGIAENVVTIRKADMNGIDYNVSLIALKQNSDDKRLENELYQSFIDRYSDKSIIPPVWHHNGPCIPAVRRIFVNADGKFYPCEKVDSDPSCEIGTLDTGLNIKKATEILNVGALTEQECISCWAVRYCNMCVRNCIDNGSLSRTVKMDHCKVQKNNALSFLKNLVKIKTKG